MSASTSSLKKKSKKKEMPSKPVADRVSIVPRNHAQFSGFDCDGDEMLDLGMKEVEKAPVARRRRGGGAEMSDEEMKQSPEQLPPTQSAEELII